MSLPRNVLGEGQVRLRRAPAQRAEFYSARLKISGRQDATSSDSALCNCDRSDSTTLSAALAVSADLHAFARSLRVPGTGQMSLPREQVRLRRQPARRAGFICALKIRRPSRDEAGDRSDVAPPVSVLCRIFDLSPVDVLRDGLQIFAGNSGIAMKPWTNENRGQVRYRRRPELRDRRGRDRSGQVEGCDQLGCGIVPCAGGGF
jgi:hypothetical protein